MTELPHGWALTTLGGIGNYLNGRGFRKYEWSEAGRPIIRIQNLTGTSSHFNYYAGEADDSYVAHRGDLLISWAATLGVYVWDGPEAVVNQHIFKVKSFIDTRFHRYLVTSVLDELRRRAHGSGMVHVTRKVFDETPVALPPLAEQQRIVAAIEEHLSRLDAAEAAVESAVAKLVALSRRIQDEVARLPGERVLTGDVTEVQGGIQKQPKRRPVKHRFPFLRVANVPRGELDLSEVHEIELFDGELERFRLQPGDLLVVEGNGSPDQVGRCAVWRGELDDCVHQNHLIRVRPGPRLDPSYLGAYWNAPSTAKAISAVASSTSGLYTLSTAKVRSVPLVVPPLDEQRRAVAKLEENLASTRALEVAIRDAHNRAAALRGSILARAFRGELLPQSPEDEPAKALLDRIAAERAEAPVPARKRG